jgi:hypothetical protein
MSFRTHTIALGIVAALAAMDTPVSAASAPDLSGQLFGEVKSAGGVAQMGASILLYNRYEQLVRHALTNESGKFAFDGLSPDVYSIRVSLASFVPAIRRNIEILAGAERVLNINLASVLSTVQMGPITAPTATLMSDEWKWVLRASQSTRPALRFLPQPHPAPTIRTAASLFTDTTGVVKVSAGGSDPLAGDMAQDLGTAFGVASSISGGAQVRVSGNLGYTPASGLPSASFRASYARAADITRGAQFALTARQVYLPLMGGSGTPGSTIGPVLRTAAMTAVDRMDLADNIHLEYGASLESISYQDRLTYVSTFGRVTYEMGGYGTVKFGYSSATDPQDLMTREGDSAESINRDLAVLSKLPRISRRDGSTRVQRNQNYEIGYAIVDGSRTYGASAFMEDISNARFLMSGTHEMFAADDLLPDLNSRGVVFNAGNFRRTGFSVSAKQALGDKSDISIAAGQASVLTAHDLARDASAEDFRNAIHAVPRPWVTVRTSTVIPMVGTHLSTSYGWTDFRTLVPIHYSLTTRDNQEIGWNVRFRQPLPAFGGMRMEAVAELRNLMAQGYLPIGSGDRRTLLTNSPRGVRGGVSFIF